MILNLHVQPGASRTEFAGKHGERIKLRLRERAVEGAANEALIEFLAEYFRVGKKSIQILSGERSRQKRVLVEGAQWPTKNP